MYSVAISCLRRSGPKPLACRNGHWVPQRMPGSRHVSCIVQFSRKAVSGKRVGRLRVQVFFKVAPALKQGVRALRELDFYVHCDLFITPMAAEADVVLPVSSAWEREGIADGFRVSQEADALLQLRKSGRATPRRITLRHMDRFRTGETSWPRRSVLQRRYRRGPQIYAGTVTRNSGDRCEPNRKASHCRFR